MAVVRHTCASCMRASRVTLCSAPIRQFSQVARGNQAQHARIRIAARSSIALPVTAHTARFFAPVVGTQARGARRHASTSPATPSSALQTVAILNPRKDPEDPATEMRIELTPRATKRLKKIMTKDENPGLCLRVSVESGGCHGFQYLMSLTSTDNIDRDEDTIFVAQEPGMDDIEGGDSYAELGIGRSKVVMDEASLELLKGSKIDFTEELIGSQFKIVDNPRAVSSCGCGTSFDVKI